ncbi:hypothetical protein GQ53DRAFT_819575 [Thozetella sp. PMI_491]|nr:hypothetical protein GQ53DRAFT_819575 [Thozetella sp. PMI_491]
MVVTRSNSRASSSLPTSSKLLKRKAAEDTAIGEDVDLQDDCLGDLNFQHDDLNDSDSQHDDLNDSDFQHDDLSDLDLQDHDLNGLQTPGDYSSDPDSRCDDLCNLQTPDDHSSDFQLRDYDLCDDDHSFENDDMRENENLRDDEDLLELDLRSKKKRKQTYTPAAEWIREQDKIFGHSSPNHPNIRRFQEKMSVLIKDLCKWAVGTKDEWAEFVQTTAQERAVSIRVRKSLALADPARVANDLFQHLPLQSQEVLGRFPLAPSDLLELPGGAEDSLHHVVYLDIVARFPRDQIVQVQSPNFRKPIKGLKEGVDVKTSSKLWVYDGSSARREGAFARIHEHLRQGNRGL